MQDIDALRFEHVSKTVAAPQGSQAVLQDVSGSVPEGSIVTIIGPSGSGKSTLLSLCNLLSTPDKGQVYVLGQEIRLWKVPELRRTVGMVLQTPTMMSGTVFDNLMLAARLHNFKLDDPKQFLAYVGLETDLLHKPALELSGGQKQRVALARTLVNRPKLLLLDEVTSALDPISMKEVEDSIITINREWGTTVLWVTHNLEQARKVGEYTWLFVCGRLVEAGYTDTFFANSKEPASRKFLAGELVEGAT